MEKYSEIRETIKAIAHQDSEQRSVFHVGTVKEVSSDGETCSVDVGGTVWTDVRLTSVADGECDFKVFPKLGSHVIVTDLSNGGMSDLAVVMYSKFERIELGEAEHTSANADILKTELDKLTRRVDTIIDAIKNATPTPQDGGAGLKTTMVAVLSGITEKEDFSGIEDDKIKH